MADTVDNIDDKLSHLKTLELIREDKRMGKIEYIFWHALLDGVEDKVEFRKYIFDSANNYNYGNPDDNADGVRKELDPNE